MDWLLIAVASLGGALAGGVAMSKLRPAAPSAAPGAQPVDFASSKIIALEIADGLVRNRSIGASRRLGSQAHLANLFVSAPLEQLCGPNPSLPLVCPLPDGGRLICTHSWAGSSTASRILLFSEDPSSVASDEPNERIRDFVDAASDWFWETDHEHRFCYFSKRAHSLLGDTVDRMIGTTRIQWARGVMSEDDVKEHEAVLARRDPFRDLIYDVPVNGEIRTVRVSGKPYFDEKGVFAGYRGSAADITNQQRTQERVDRAELRLRDAMEAIEDGLVLFDDQDRLELANRRFGELYPGIRDLLRPGSPFPDIWEAAIQRGSYNIGGQSAEDALKQRLEQHYKADGTTNEHRTQAGRWVRYNERRLGDGSVVGIWSDVTDLRSQQELAQKQYRLLRGIMTHLPIALLAIGADGRLITWNNKLFDLFDYPIHLASTETHIEELIRLNVARGVYGVTVRDAEPLVRERVAALTGDTNLVERWTLPNDKVVEMVSTPLQGGGRVLTLTDVTAFQEAQQVLSKANQMKDGFITHLSHEMRTPLNSVLGLCEMTLDCEIDDRVRTYVSAIARAAESLLHSIASIASLMRLDHTGMEGRRDAIDIAHLVQTALEDTRSLVDPDKIHVEAHVAPDMTLGLYGHRSAIRDILQNLAAHAADRLQTGTIRIEASVRPLTGGGALLRLVVSDEGPPPDADMLRAVAAPVEDAGEGTEVLGLLLSVAKRLADAMDGSLKIELKSQSTEFIAELPLERDGMAAEKAEGLSGCRIAVLASDPERAARLAERISRFGAEIMSAENGIALLTRIIQAEAAGKPCQAVVIDGRVRPEESINLARRMRRERKLRDLHLVALDLAGEVTEQDFDAVVRSDDDDSSFMEALIPPQQEQDPTPLAPQPGPKPEAQGSATLKILLVEDNQVNQLVAVGMLEKRGYNVTVAENGIEALEAIDKDRFDIILMDIQMPGMDGMEATRRIRRLQDPVGRIPIIAVTANAMPGDAERYFAVGMNGYVPKPIDKATLFEAIEEWTGTTDIAVETDAPDASAPPAQQTPEPSAGQEDSVEEDFDFSTLAAMEDDLGRETILALVSSYLNDAAQRRVGLDQAQADRDAKMLEREAHTLKGMAGNLGIQPVFVISKEIVSACRSEDIDGAFEKTPQLVKVIDAAEIAIKREFSM